MPATIHFRTFYRLVCCKKTKLKYTTVFLHIVLYGCKTWSLTLREEQTEGPEGAEENVVTEEG
jgi:hypothetical protein